MKMSLPGLVANLTALAEDLEARIMAGDPIDEDWLFEHQPRLQAFMVGEVLRNLRLVANDPTSLEEFLDFVDVKSDAVVRGVPVE